MSWWPTVPAWIYGDPKWLTLPSTKLTEMMLPTNQPTRQVHWQGRGTLGAWRRSPSLGAAAGQPVFFNSAGQAINNAVCGVSFGFTVPGYEGQQVYLIQTLNGQPHYSGLFAVPLASWTSVCGSNEGNYVTNAYDASTGQSLGSVAFTILPQGSTASAPGPAVPTVAVSNGGGGPGPSGPLPGIPIHATGSLNLTPTTMIIAAVAAYWLFARK